MRVTRSPQLPKFLSADTKRTSLAGAQRQRMSQAQQRIILLGALFILGFLAVALRVADIALMSATSEPDMVVRAETEKNIVTGRASIVDRNNVLLATSVPTASLYANPREILDVAEAVKKLTTVFPQLHVAELQQRLSSKRHFVWIKRHLSPREQYRINAIGLPGLHFQTDHRRVYPQGRLMAHVLGYTNIDNEGLAGVEQYFDRRLRTQNTPLMLSLDVRVQHALRDEIQNAVKRFKAKGGAGLVMNVNTGEMLGMVVNPDFDANDPDAAPKQHGFNKLSLGVYEMGSTLKIINTAMALESGKIDLYSKYDARTAVKAGRFMIDDFKPQRRILTVAEIFMHSSNIGSVKMALDVGRTVQQEFFKKLGLLDPVPIELLETSPPLIPNPWRDVNTMTISFGHGIAMTPLHLAAAVSSIINGGVQVMPTLLPVNGRVRDVVRVVKPETSEKIRRLMRLVVEHGTGGQAAVKGYVVGGKTGSAEKLGGATYETTKLLSSFMAAFPMQSPQYIVFVMLDEPQGSEETFGYATGGWTAAPTVAKVIARIAPFVNISAIDEHDRDLQRQMAVDIPEIKEKADGHF